MKNSKFAKKVVAQVVGALMAVSVMGCGKAADSGASASADIPEVAGVQKVVIGSGINYNPYCYLDENGEAVGYEYDLLKEIDELLPQYEFEYQSMAFDQLVLSLESGKIDVAAHQYEYTDERAEKYLLIRLRLL